MRTGQLCVVFDWRAESHHSQRFPNTRIHDGHLLGALERDWLVRAVLVEEKLLVLLVQLSAKTGRLAALVKLYTALLTRRRVGGQGGGSSRRKWQKRCVVQP